MSPKSRGRPKGRGRPIKKRHLASTRPLTLPERVMMEALHLGHDAPRLTAEMAASQWLGEAWASAGLGQRHAERDLVEALVGELLQVGHHKRLSDLRKGLVRRDLHGSRAGAGGPEPHELAVNLRTVGGLIGCRSCSTAKLRDREWASAQRRVKTC